MTGIESPSNAAASRSTALSPAYKKRKLSPSAVVGNVTAIPQISSPGRSSRDEGNSTIRSTSIKTGKRMRHGSESVAKPLTTSTYNTSMFQLQIEEMLVKVQPKEERMIEAENALRKVKDIIERIQNREPKPV